MKKFLNHACLLLFILASLSANAQDKILNQIKQYLLQNDKLFSERDLQELQITNDYVTSRNKLRHVYFSQAVSGIRIINSHASSVFSPEGSLLNLTHKFYPSLEIPSRGPQPAISLESCIKHTLASKVTGLDVEVKTEPSLNKWTAIIGGENYHHETLAELVFYMDGERSIQLAWAFDAEFKNAEWFQYIVDAENGNLLKRYSWTTSCAAACQSQGAPKNHNHSFESMPPPADGSSYNVLALPLESPSHGDRTFENEPATLAASPFGWHDINGVDGAEFTITRGNNVYSYEDANDENEPGFSPDGGVALQFDFAYNPTLDPEQYQEAAITNLFYVNNRMHDIMYGYGFDEAAGNFQQTNYSGLGADGDHVEAEAQDGGGINNANFATPPDGFNPRMQMFLWQASANLELLEINTPEVLEGLYNTSAPSGFGPSIPANGVTANMALALDDSGDETDACQFLVNATELVGKIAVVRRGSCNFTEKVIAVQNANAVACIIANNVPGIVNPGGASSDISIPSLMISQSDGDALINALMSGIEINATLLNAGGLSLIDASFDNGVILHEYTHGISNRLTGGPSESSCLVNEEQMGEGWSDFYAIMLTQNELLGNAVTRPVATFAANQNLDGNGIRPVPYDTSFAVNSFTYADVSNEALTVPHGVGFVWATMLWDLNWAFIEEYGFDPDIESGSGGNNILLQLVTDALKLQICQPGFVDGRDAILLADEFNNDGINTCLIWKVFAKRGLGFSADQGSSQNRYDGTAAFDLPIACQDVFAAPTAAFTTTATSSCTGIIQFIDQSSDNPQAWSWDFGDGSTSTDQNPIHTYDMPGDYSVSLTVTNTLGEDTNTQLNLISIEVLPAPSSTQGAAGCAGDFVVLTAESADGTIEWTNAWGNVVAVGNEFTTQLNNSTQVFQAQSLIDNFEPAFIGPDDADFGTGGNHNTAFIGAVNFQAFQPLTIVSAYVVSGAVGLRTISLYDGPPETSNIVDQVTVDIDFIGGGRIEIGFEVEEPGNYSMGLPFANLYRSDSGVNYPYSEPGVLTITGSPAGPSYYYYFYDIEVDLPKCLSEGVDVVAEVIGNAEFWIDASGLTISLIDLSSSSDSWFWNFGDGTSSTLANPTHTYAMEGNYTITLTTNGICSSNQAVNLSLTSIASHENHGIFIGPNPAHTYLDIQTDESEVHAEFVVFYDLSGKTVLEQRRGISGNWKIDLNGLGSGLYLLSVLDRDRVSLRTQRVVIAH